MGKEAAVIFHLLEACIITQIRRHILYKLGSLTHCVTQMYCNDKNSAEVDIAPAFGEIIQLTI